MARRQIQGGAQHQQAFFHHAAVAVGQLRLLKVQAEAAAVRRRAVDGGYYLGHFAVEGSRVHDEPAAQCAGDAGSE